MKNSSIKKLTIFAVAGTLLTGGIVVGLSKTKSNNGIIDAYGLGFPLKSFSRNLEKPASIEISRTFVQTLENTNSFDLRFAVAVEMNGAVESISMTRTLDGETKIFDVDTVYKYLILNGENYYYDPLTDSLTNTATENDYYFAAYTVAINSGTENTEKMLDSSFKVNAVINGELNSSFVESSYNAFVSETRCEEVVMSGNDIVGYKYRKTHGGKHFLPHDPICLQDGNLDCWVCSGCHEVYGEEPELGNWDDCDDFSEAAGEDVEDYVISAEGHKTHTIATNITWNDATGKGTYIPVIVCDDCGEIVETLSQEEYQNVNVGTAAEFRAMLMTMKASFINKEAFVGHYTLTANIDLTTYTAGTKKATFRKDCCLFNEDDGGNLFTGDMRADWGFQGVIDGNGYEVINADLGAKPYLSLFGPVGKNGVIKNISVTGSSGFYGAIIASRLYGTVDNVRAIATGMYGGDSDDYTDGIIAADVESGAIVRNCVVYDRAPTLNNPTHYGSFVGTLNHDKVNNPNILFDNNFVISDFDRPLVGRNTYSVDVSEIAIADDEFDLCSKADMTAMSMLQKDGGIIKWGKNVIADNSEILGTVELSKTESVLTNESFVSNTIVSVKAGTTSLSFTQSGSSVTLVGSEVETLAGTKGAKVDLYVNTATYTYKMPATIYAEISTTAEMSTFLSSLVTARASGYTGYYRLVNDINISTLTGATYFDGSSASATNKGFLGTFDGMGHKITGLKLDNANSGLFGSVGATGLIKNLYIENAIYGVSAAWGGLVAMNCFGTIENVCVTAVSNNNNTSGRSLLVWNLQSGGNVKDCLVVDKSTYALNTLGCVVHTQNGTVTNCYSVSTMSNAKVLKNSKVNSDGTSLSDWYETFDKTKLSSLSDDGTNIKWFEHIIGQVKVTNIDKTFSVGNTSKTVTIPELAGVTVSSVKLGETELTPTQVGTTLTFSSLGSLENGIYDALMSTNAGKFTTKVAICQEVSTADEMKDILDAAQKVKATANGYQGYFVLTNDIDLSTALNTGDLRGAAYNGAGCGTGQGFNAYFDGQGHIIKGVNLLGSGTTARYLGLFGSIGKDAVIKNLVAEIELGWASTTYTQGGGLAYNCNGLIENVCVKGNIKNGGSAVYNSLFCATLQTNGKIKNCLGVDLSASGFDKVGLLAGNVASGLSQIENSVAITQAQKATAGMYNYAVRAVAGSTASPQNATVSSLTAYYGGLGTNPFEGMLADDGTNITWLGSIIGTK